MLNQAKFIFHLLKFSKDPTNTVEVFRFTDQMVTMASKEDRKIMADAFLEDKKAKELYAHANSQYLKTPFNLQECERYRPGTLGAEYARMMRLGGFDPEFYEHNKVFDVESFFILRMRKTHDLYHVVTGFGTDVPGELGLQAFYIGQLFSPVPVAILVSGLLWVAGTKNRDIIRDSFDQIVYGYELGKRSDKLWGVIWEDMWQMDLHTIRSNLNITPYQLNEVAI